MLFRVLQTFGSSSGHAVGAGVLGDIYKLEERGTAMGVYWSVRIQMLNILSVLKLLFSKVVLLGPALAPLAGGTLNILLIDN